METKKETNYLIDWGQEDREHKINYFKALRMMLEKIEHIADFYTEPVTTSLLKVILRKYNIYFLDIDDIPRVNIDFPKEN